MVSTLPKTYVAIMGIEKLVPTLEDAFVQYQALVAVPQANNSPSIYP